MGARLTSFSNATCEEDIADPPKIVSLPPPGSIRRLASLRRSSIPQLVDIIEKIRTETGLSSEYNEKSSIAAKAKSIRPDLLERSPWMTLAHLRDYLRFRTRLRNLDDFEAVFRVLEGLCRQKEITLVKVDTKKLLNPGEFGWRMIAIDIRLGSGMLVEHYMTFDDLIRINDDWLHAVYEKWRNVAIATFGEARHRQRDAEFSASAYREIFYQRALVSAHGSAILTSRLGVNRSASDFLANRLSI